MAAGGLMIGGVHDSAEKEADRVADRVMRMPASPSTVRRECKECAAEDKKVRRQPEEQQEEGTLQTKSAGSPMAPGKSSVPASTTTATAIRSMGSGKPLTRSDRSFFEPRFGADLSSVRVHDGPAADRASRSAGARAFALGKDIAFAKSEHQPETNAGKRLLAHELAHTQQENKSDLASATLHRQLLNEEDAELPNPPPDVVVEGPHIVVGRSDPRRVRRIRRRQRERENSQLRQAVVSWARNRGTRQSYLLGYFGDWNDGSSRIHEQKSTLISNYRSARENVTRKTSAAGETSARRRAFASFVTGMVPGFGQAIGSLRAASVGLGSAVDRFYSASLRSATSRVEAPLTGIVNELVGAQTVPGANAESVDHFALRLTQSMLVIQEEITRISQFAAVLGSDDMRTQSDRTADEIQGARSPTSTLLAEARRIQAMEEQWEPLSRSISRFNGRYSNLRSQLLQTSEFWTSNRLEAMLWIVYISQLSSDQTRVIDNDEIEDRLVELSVIGTDGGSSYLGLDFGEDTDPLGLARDTWLAQRRALAWQHPIEMALQTFDKPLSQTVLTLRPSEIV